MEKTAEIITEFEKALEQVSGGETVVMDDRIASRI